MYTILESIKAFQVREKRFSDLGLTLSAGTGFLDIGRQPANMEGNMHDDETREISEEKIEQISGGIISGGIDAVTASADASAWGACPPCPHCGSTNTRPYGGFAGLSYACGDCDTAFS